MKLAVGTSGFAYAEWRGTFYPDDLPAAELLRFYAERLPAVEINNTFYRMPKPSVLESWAAQVPPDFRFAIKASRRITHLKRLKDVGEETAYLLQVLGALGERLGAVLFQCPPNLKLDLARFEAFLALLPGSCPAAFEFRHPSWACDDVFARLRARAFAWVGVDADDAALGEIVSTAPFGYLRLRRPAYTADELDAWCQRIRAAGWDEAFVFFKHEDAGAGPKLAAQLRETFGRSLAPPGPRAVRRPAARPAREGGRR
jgi:uncharacterized protein YecE (DUF72 family)